MGGGRAGDASPCFAGGEDEAVSRGSLLCISLDVVGWRLRGGGIVPRSDSRSDIFGQGILLFS